MAPEKITQELVRKLFHYDPETGAITWRERQTEDFPNDKGRRAWNARCAGRIAGTPNPKSGHWQIRVHGKLYYSARIAWIYAYGEMPEYIDHISGDPCDNRICNLRNVTRAENNRNQRVRKDNKTGYPGLQYRKKPGRAPVWVVCISDRHYG